MELTKDKYTGAYDAEVKQSYEKLKNRPAFKYEAASDPSFKAYRDTYRREGQAAMKNTMAEAADLTGGYGSSYAQRVGQQQYGEYLKKLSDAMPELYEKAYKRYVQQGETLRQQFDAASDMAQKDYGRYKDERDYQQNKEQLDHKKQQDAYGNLADVIASTGYLPSEEELAQAGMSAELANALNYEFMRKNGLLPAAGAAGGRVNYYNLSPTSPFDIGYREGMFERMPIKQQKG